MKFVTAVALFISVIHCIQTKYILLALNDVRVETTNKIKAGKEIFPEKQNAEMGAYRLGAYKSDTSGDYSKSSLENHPNRGLVNRKNCGRTFSFNQKIVGGTDASIKDFPWLTLVGEVDKNNMVNIFYCGGALITKDVVLTASHCLYHQPRGRRRAKLRVKVGATRRHQKDGFQEIDVARKIKHENYISEQGTFNNDIALLKLVYPVKMKSASGRLNTVCLPFDEDPGETYEAETLTVAGWGYTEVDSKGVAKSAADTLQKVDVPVVNIDKCARVLNATYRREDVSTEKNICAGGLKGRDSCNGDSGGPLMKSRMVGFRKRWTEVGIVSWGVSCAKKNYPGVYTNVRYFLKWILDNI